MVKAYVRVGSRERKVKRKKEIKERTKIGLLYSKILSQLRYGSRPTPDLRRAVCYECCVKGRAFRGGAHLLTMLGRPVCLWLESFGPQREKVLGCEGERSIVGAEEGGGKEVGVGGRGRK